MLEVVFDIRFLLTFSTISGSYDKWGAEQSRKRAEANTEEGFQQENGREYRV